MAKHKPTITGLTADLKAANEEAQGYMSRLQVLRQELEAANAEVKRVRSQFDDLKQRLQTAESENQRMRGYIERVQEDDTVREELVAVGDPEGEQRMVPKRKPTRFEAPRDYADEPRDRFMGYMERDRPKPKHWITY